MVLSNKIGAQLIGAADQHFEKVLTTLRKRGQDRGDVGAFIRLYTEDETGEMATELAFSVGEHSTRPGRESEIYRNSKEKGERLHRHPTHVSAWQSRDEHVRSFGGAIRITILIGNEPIRAILSMSGLIEHGDETVLLLIARHLGWKVETGLIIELSDNQLARELLAHAA